MDLLTIKGIISDPKKFLDRTMHLYETDREKSVLWSTFVEQEYYWFYKRIKPNTTILDIGANIGDTAIYFAYNPNTKHVFSYELMPGNYQKAIRNIQKSPFGDRIIIANQGVACKEGVVKIGNTVPTATSNIKEAVAETGEEVKLVSLNSILQEKKKVALKCDIEGEEENLFDGVDLKDVYLIMIECHSAAIAAKLTTLFKMSGFETEEIRKFPNDVCLVGAFKERRTK